MTSSEQQLDLDAIQTKTAELRQRIDRKNPWPSDNESHWMTEGWKNGTRNALDKLHTEALVAEIRRLRAELDAEQSAHRFTLRQRNNRSERLLYLRDVAKSGQKDLLVEEALNTLAASVTDHLPADADEMAASLKRDGFGADEIADICGPGVTAGEAPEPTQLRWGLDDVMWGDDDTITVLLSGPAGEPYWLELDPERAAALRTDLAGPDGEEADRCGARHHQYPDTVCTEPPGHYRRDVDPHAGPLVIDGRERGGAAWDEPAADRRP
ncbi:hypothetical protein GCM10018980_51410 [Streptomyces capoamus]|uniref:Uncharacterized protein n=1 Tax=Streptomyces capoamus TaxID=68183 RepID=A0A919EZC8_9ACTN|nr:hypothetical protein [Streptomyces capoamus]GGW15817.1 hypothetical protein GCM10010501_29400 [Streptomyces libani subsp. rufus]GHG61898.1 hypothetical protein GCM10018980_51410 [Streptomyces capoamus]